jgi:GTP cyclohydrolase II
VITHLYERRLTTLAGEWKEILFYDGRSECTALVFGDVSGGAPVLCRIHSDCLSSHLLMSVECDCRDQMILAQERIAERGSGVIIALPQDGRGYGHQMLMVASSEARNTGVRQSEVYRREKGHEDGRDYSTAAAVLGFLKVEQVELLTNNPLKVKALEQYGLSVTSIVPCVVPEIFTSPHLRETFLDKQLQGHILEG